MWTMLTIILILEILQIAMIAYIFDLYNELCNYLNKNFKIIYQNFKETRKVIKKKK